MNRDDEIRLKHMLDAAREAESFVVGLKRTALDANRMLVLAVIKDIEIIGEAASKVSDECHNQYPQIPWRDITGMRNHLIHGYFKINLDQVWSTLQDDLPPLIAELEKILARI
jgi:uncharacterized protein with HEPN domain